MRRLETMNRWARGVAIGAAGVCLTLGLGGCPEQREASTIPEPPGPPADPGGVYVDWSLLTYGGGGEGGEAMRWVTLGSLHTTPEWGPALKSSLTVTAPSGAVIHEVWPPSPVTTGEARGPSVTWADFTIRRDACAKGWAPAAEAPACQTLGAQQPCAASRLPSWSEGVGGHCVVTDEVQSQALLLRGGSAVASPPIAQVSPNRWKNVGETAVHALMIRDASEPERLHFVAELAAGASVSLDDRTAEEGGKAPYADRARAHLSEAGLFEGQIAASLRAQDELAPKGWVARGLLSRDAVDRLVTVGTSLDPELRAVRAGLFTIAP